LTQAAEGDILFRDLTWNVLGQSLEIRGDITAAADVYRDAFLSRRRTGNKLGTAIILTNLAFARNELGQRRQAVEWCQQVISEEEAQSGHALSLSEGVCLPLSLLSLEANGLDVAQKQAQTALALCQQANIIDGVLWAQYVLASVHLAEGEVEEMQALCQEARRLASRAHRPHGAWFAALEAQASMTHGNLADAASWAQATNLSPTDTPRRWDGILYSTYVRLLLAQDRPEEAQTLLATMERLAKQSQRRRSLITVYLQQGLVCQAVDDTPEALNCIERALRLAAPQDYRRAFMDEGPPIVALLPRLRHIAPAFVDGLLPSRAEGGRATETQRMALVEPLTDRELQILRLIAAGRSNPEIAQRLYLSLNTVKWHAKNLYGKLGVNNRIEAVTRAQDLDLL
jgi:LuxR family maltose regulon positive regulatory protein